jgi:hypothetical protein
MCGQGLGHVGASWPRAWTVVARRRPQFHMTVAETADPPPDPTTELIEGAAAAQYFARHGYALVTSVLAPAAMASFMELQAAMLREWQTAASLVFYVYFLKRNFVPEFE